MDTNSFLKAWSELKASRGQNDAQMARTLGFSRQYISDVKVGKVHPSLSLIFKVCDAQGYVWTRDRLLGLLPDEIAEKIRESDNKRSMPDDQENK